MSNNAELEFLCENIQRDYPDVWAQIYPHRLLPPGGYLNPRLYSPTLFSALLNSPDASRNLVSSVMFMTARKLIKNLMPVYFVGKDFLEDVANSKIESDFKASEIAWPEDAMMFVFPEKFARSFNDGLYVPWMTLAHASVKEVHENPYVAVMESRKELIGVKYGILMVTFQYFKDGDDLPTDYIWQYPDVLTFRDVTDVSLSKDHPITTTVYEQAKIDAGIKLEIGLTDEEKERNMLTRMYSLALKLILAMTAEPEFIDQARCIHRKAKDGRERGDLWEPRRLGFKYSRPRRDQGGTHAPMPFHRHPGYFRWRQHYGPGNSLVKTLWIRPYYVGAKRGQDKI